jgi:phosphatidylserine decarboxylase
MTAMQHSGKAATAGLKLVGWGLALLIAILGAGIVAHYMAKFILMIAGALLGVWLLFAAFTFYFFRDPDPRVPGDADAIVAPGHGKVDLVDEMTESEFPGGPCRRVSIFLSVFDVHVQQSPVAGRITQVRHTPGQFINAMRTDCSLHNENVLIGIESAEKPGERIGVRLIAGLIARRIVPWVTISNTVARGERIGLIQFGSRVDLYLPVSTRVAVKPGDRVVGGETIVARRS